MRTRNIQMLTKIKSKQAQGNIIMAEDKFKLPNSSYEEITKIIKSYGHFTVPAGLDEVSKLISMDKTVISRNVGFLLELNLLGSGQKKALTPEGKAIAQALEHEMPEEIRNCWRTVVSENEFMSKLVAAVKIRNGMDDNTFQSHIAYSAGQPKKPQFMTGAKTIIDILRASELIRESDGKFIVSKADGFEEGSSTEWISSNSESVAMNVPASVVQRAVEIQSSGTQIMININVTVDCSVNELEGLGEKLNKIIRQVNSDDYGPEDLAEE